MVFLRFGFRRRRRFASERVEEFRVYERGQSAAERERDRADGRRGDARADDAGELYVQFQGAGKHAVLDLS